MTLRLYRTIIVLSLVLAGSYTSARARQPDPGAASSQRAISGTPGFASAHAVVNLAALARLEADRPAAPANQEIHPFMALPADSPAPAPPAALVDPAPAAPSAPASPAPASSFQALGDNNTSIPPDTHGAVGPNHAMTVLNTQVRVQSRTGSTLSTVTLNTFWSSVNGGNGAFDPKVFYDPASSRWMFVACDDSRSAGSGVLIGVSQTDDPTGNWNLYKVDADGADAVWADYPSVGFNKDWIVVQMNMYNVTDNAFNRSHIYVFKKADLYAAVGATHTLISSNTIGGTQVPALTYDNTLATLHLLQNWNSGTGTLRQYSITGAVGAEVLTPINFISVADIWAGNAPASADFAAQLGSAQKIQNNDSRLQNVVYRNGRLWTTHTIFLPSANPTRSAIQWWEINPATSAVVQRARIDDSSGPVFHGFPSIAVNKDNAVLIGYSRFAAAQYASANYSFRSAADPINTLRPDVALKAGEAPYYKTFSGTRNRWGDYSSTMVDPVNDTDMWTIQEYAAPASGGSDRWATWWGRIVPPAVTVTPSSGLTTTEAGGTATFTVVLASPPTADVSIALLSSDTTEGTVGATPLTFTASTWDTAQTVTITGVDDSLDDGDIGYTITTAASSSDASYSGIAVADVSVTNIDDDEQQLIPVFLPLLIQ
jgi:hypothetical protein